MSGLPLPVLSRLEWLQPRIRFELASEGRQISPPWYLGELILREMAENTQAAINFFTRGAEAIYERWITPAGNSNLLWIGAAILARELEYSRKLRFRHRRLSDYWADIGSNRRVEGLAWPALDYNEIDRRRIQHERRIVQLMTTHSAALSRIERPDSYPDFAGQFLHTAGEALFVAMSEDDATTVSSLFPDFFQSSLLQFNTILGRASRLDWRSDVAAKVAVSPVLDLMDLSGYAILFSELYSDRTIIQPVISLWTDYLDSADRSAPVSKASFLATAISLTDSTFEIAHRSVIRTSWKLKVSERLRQLERRPVPERGPFWNETAVVHDSPIVRLYAENDVIPYDGIDLFIEGYLRSREDARDLQFGRLRGRLGEALRRRERSLLREVQQDDE